MAFERSEYLYFLGVVLTSLLLVEVDSVIILGLATALVMVSLYVIVLRMSTDHEAARLWRIIGAILTFAIAALSTGALALITASVALITAFLAAHEHRSIRSYIPVHRS